MLFVHEPFDHDHWRIIQYSRNTETNPKEPGAAHDAPAARSIIRSRDTAPYFLRPRVRSTLHSQVSQTFESLAPGRVYQANPNTCCLAGQAIEPEAQGRAPQRNPNNLVRHQELDVFSSISFNSGATMHPNDHWISSRSVALIGTRQTVPLINDFDSAI